MGTSALPVWYDARTLTDAHSKTKIPYVDNFGCRFGSSWEGLLDQTPTRATCEEKTKGSTVHHMQSIIVDIARSDTNSISLIPQKRSTQDEMQAKQPSINPSSVPDGMICMRDPCNDTRHARDQRYNFTIPVRNDCKFVNGLLSKFGSRPPWTHWPGGGTSIETDNAVDTVRALPCDRVRPHSGANVLLRMAVQC